MPAHHEAFSPVDNETPLRWWRRLRLVPADSLGTGRRALLLALLTWLPVVAWAVAKGGGVYGGEGEPFRVHYGIHVRCLIVIPLLVLAEWPLHVVGKTIATQFVTSGVVTEALRPGFDRVVESMVRLRDASLPWAFAVGAAIAWTIADPPAAHGDELSWALGPDGQLGFGGAWFAYVSRPILLALLVGWLWRLLLVSCWMWRTSRLGLVLVPAHPDRVGGIGFVSSLPAGFALVTLGLSAMVASSWAFQILYRGATLQSYQLPLLAFVLGWLLLLLIPLLVFIPALWRTRWKALPRFAALAGLQGRLVHRLWIDSDEPDTEHPLLEPRGLGVTADMGAAYEVVAHMQLLPVRKETFGAILLPMAIPFVLLALASMPLREIMSTLLSVLK